MVSGDLSHPCAAVRGPQPSRYYCTHTKQYSDELHHKKCDGHTILAMTAMNEQHKAIFVAHAISFVESIKHAVLFCFLSSMMI